MSDELVRVLAYPKIARQHTLRKGTAPAVLAVFDQFAHIVSPAPAPAAPSRLIPY